MAEKLLNSDMEKISGGILDEEIDSATFGVNIVCPRCGASSASDIELNKNQDILVHPEKYHCKHCDCYFDVKKS